MKDLTGIGMTSQRTRDRLIAHLKELGIKDERVLSVMRKVPRHLFMAEALSSRAYENTSLPIGHGQTISQPYMVARMTELLIEDGLPENVLEVGTGSGYQSAILASLIPRVFSVERIRPLQEQAKRVLADIGVRNISFKHSDGGWGWKACGPYQAILAAAAPAEIPMKLLEQLTIGARLIIPVGKEGQQVLQRVTRTESAYEVETIEEVSFVPFLKGRA
ncbi:MULTISPECIES: protein-L-isoaspartate(D-aspartate) O-methyltransferase [Cycloclasticus]|jgi:protein-L-isoaspartate(D-aspartate) O-methyltransferase|uniref:protein-L-isoaspartate(D-aspartate) O-methyltransferase n=1 Tax=Cycloclasticus TaxID=34067 RepID=UPI0003748C93|nr:MULTISPECIES: protein-L-isoaspartate(D-aspartate) O-methyltransferase [Cycloclasticus]MBV1897946.1 protein-L-isoaspartate(D-aspartate) O-methyltransferase [Cycloclasticus sp.]PHR47858.1 MAG: protein-L-isoaspartate(D-aspartate) O-methyltransferase [Cycloclasticus sp.]SHJ35585.1 protein-L-isoaspartate(D-aspartate) O-methyltransferase [Cycloclasticus pugetii]|tara:strand:- start:474 stop:1130 length:657 start_codon:yes stop_codon:yes gene_type:complete